MNCNLKTDYLLKNEGLKLNVKIGDGQIGSSVVFLDTKQISIGDIIDKLIGDVDSLHNKKLIIKTIISDVNDKTNHMSVTYVLNDGIKDNVYFLEGTVTEEGGSLTFRAEFNLV
jgi:hypothetical protein